MILEDVLLITRDGAADNSAGCLDILDTIRRNHILYMMFLPDLSEERQAEEFEDFLQKSRQYLGDIPDGYIYISSYVDYQNEGTTPKTLIHTLAGYRERHSIIKPTTFLILQTGEDALPPKERMAYEFHLSQVQDYVRDMGKEIWADTGIAPVCLEIPPYPGRAEWELQIQAVAEETGQRPSEVETELRRRLLCDMGLAESLVIIFLRNPSITLAGTVVKMYHERPSPSGNHQRPRWSAQ